MSSCEVATLVNALACGIAKCISKDDLPLFIAILGQLGATLATITIQEGINTPPPDVAPGVEIITAPLRY